MNSSEQSSMPDEMPDAAGADGLECLATAIASYLDEISADALVCRQHETTTAVSTTGMALCLCRYFPWTETADRYVRDTALRLSGWEATPFWEAGGLGWRGLTSRREGNGAREPIIARGVAWEGWPIFVHASLKPTDQLLRLELLLPHVCMDVPESPIRRLARGLRCHAFLLPGEVAAPVTSAAGDRGGPLTPRGFLMRAVPPNLHANQCFSDAAEGK